MHRQRGTRATNQSKNILTNLPGRQLQPYINWKSRLDTESTIERFNESYQPTNNKTYNLGVASNSFYNINAGNNNYTHDGFGQSRNPNANKTKCPGDSNDYVNGSFIKFKPNPIKHWRKQLLPNQSVNSRQVSIRQAIDIPGGTNRLDAKTGLNENPENFCSKNVHHISNYVKNNDMSIDNIRSNQDGCKIYNPQRIQRSASTIVKKNYHQTHSAYLRSRVKLYNQNQSLSQIPGNQYENSGRSQVLPPSDSRTRGSQLFNSTYILDSSYSQSCISSCNYPKIIYKPNNVNFSKEGAVTSNLRTFNLQRIEINKNADSLKNNFGTSAVNNSQYRGIGEAPITTKTFNQILPGGQACKNVQIRNTQNSGRKLSGGSGRHVVCLYNQEGLHNSDIVPSVNGNIIIKNRGIVNFRIWGKGDLFPQKFNCQTIRQAISRTRQSQNNNIAIFHPNCQANNKNPPNNSVGTNGEPLSATHR